MVSTQHGQDGTRRLGRKLVSCDSRVGRFREAIHTESAEKPAGIPTAVDPRSQLLEAVTSGTPRAPSGDRFVVSRAEEAYDVPESEPIGNSD